MNGANTAKRLDQWLVDFGWAPSRTKAQELLEWGAVSLNGRMCKKPGVSLTRQEAESLAVQSTDLFKYVSRGGLKLEKALSSVGLNPKGWRCLDIGLSTGGFADSLLQAGAQEVYGVDVGTDQVAPALKRDARLKVFEQVNVKALPDHPQFEGQVFDLAVVDVSFISLDVPLKILPRFFKESGQVLALIKPQFEVGAEALGKKGVVKDVRLFDEVRLKILRVCDEVGLRVIKIFPSAIQGRDGNQEYFVYAVNHNSSH